MYAAHGVHPFLHVIACPLVANWPGLTPGRTRGRFSASTCVGFSVSLGIPVPVLRGPGRGRTARGSATRACGGVWRSLAGCVSSRRDSVESCVHTRVRGGARCICFSTGSPLLITREREDTGCLQVLTRVPSVLCLRFRRRRRSPCRPPPAKAFQRSTSLEAVQRTP